MENEDGGGSRDTRDSVSDLAKTLHEGAYCSIGLMLDGMEVRLHIGSRVSDLEVGHELPVVLSQEQMRALWRFMNQDDMANQIHMKIDHHHLFIPTGSRDSIGVYLEKLGPIILLRNVGVKVLWPHRLAECRRKHHALRPQRGGPTE